jgi:hypothetical protein
MLLQRACVLVSRKACFVAHVKDNNITDNNDDLLALLLRSSDALVQRHTARMLFNCVFCNVIEFCRRL